MDIKQGRRAKTKRNLKIMEYVAKGYSFESIAGIFHITKSRVSQIVSREIANKEEIRNEQ